MDQKPTFILSSSSCSSEGQPDHLPGCKFQVKWKINPHMKVGAVSADMAIAQHESFAQFLRKSGADVIELPFIHGAYDSVFIKDNAILVRTEKEQFALLANPHFESRQIEPQKRAFEFEKLGFKTLEVQSCFEGGDFVMFPDLSQAYLGYGFRSEKAAAKELSEFLEIPVTGLELTDSHFYHLDTALNFTFDNRSDSPRVVAFGYKEAFTNESWKILESDRKIGEIIYVNHEEAMSFGLNWVEVNETIVLGKQVPKLTSALESLGKKVHVSPLSEFQLAGGSAACLSSRVFPLEYEH